MKLKDILDQNFAVKPGGGKLEIYQCMYCEHKYARHPTRMGLHLLKCVNCPKEVKDLVKGKVNSIYNDSKNVSFTKVIMENFKSEPPLPDQKLEIFSCKYCNKHYARNATRMHLHLLKCRSTPVGVKDTLRQSSSRSQPTLLKMQVKGRSKNTKKILEESFYHQPPDPNQKLDMFQCRYCSQRYARHATRMSLHLLKCANCPIEIKEAMRDTVSGTVISTPIPKRGATRSKKLLDTYFTLVPRQSNQKMEVVKCRYCSQKYARHATRMNLHLLKCTNCPPYVKERVKSILNCNRNGENIDSGNNSSKPQEQNNCQELFAKALYSSGAPLNLVENEHWREFFNALNPHFKVPDREQLSGSLLEKSYQSIKVLVDDKINEAKSVGIQVDSSFSSIINIVVTTPNPVYLKTLASFQSYDQTEHRSELADYLSELIEAINPKKIIGICSERKLCSMKVYEILEEKYNNHYISFYNCSLQSINQILKIIIEQASVSEILKSATSLIKEIDGSNFLSSTLSVIQNSLCNDDHEHVVLMELPAKGDWVTYLTCLESLYENKDNLQVLLATEKVDENMTENSKDLICDQEFWTRVLKLIEIMKPLEKWINHIKNSESNLSDIYEIFNSLEKHYLQELEQNNFDKLILDTVKYCLNAEAVSLLKSIHFAANILNPLYKGENLSQEAFVEGTSYITKLAVKFGLPEDKVLIDLANYNSCKGIWSESYIKKSITLMSPCNWWRGVCKMSTLSKLGSAILEQPATSIAPLKKRTIIKNSVDEKLAYIFHNLKLLKASEVQIEENNVELKQLLIPNHNQNMEDNKVLGSVPIENEEYIADVSNIKIEPESTDICYYQIVNEAGEIFLVKQL